MQTSNENNLFLAIDANAIIHRAFHAYPNTLVTSKGIQVDAVFGFTSMLLSVLEKFKPKYIACAFDTSKPTFRHTDFPEYKAQRKPTDQSLVAQFPLVEEVLKAFNIPIIRKPGFEADDILGDLASKVIEGKWSDYGLKMMIVSGDRDLLQLIRGEVYVCLPEGSFRNLVIFDEENTYKKMGVKPDQIVDYKAIVGDASDNIPGVKGIGSKSVIKFLEKYGSVDELYKHLNEIPPRQAKMLLDGVEQMELSRKLAKIISNTGISIDLESCLLKDFDRREVIRLFGEYEFRTLINKIPQNAEEKKTQNGQIGMFGVEAREIDLNDENTVNTIGDIPTRGIKELLKTRGKYDDKLLEGGRVIYWYKYSKIKMNDELGQLFQIIVDNLGQLNYEQIELVEDKNNIKELLGFMLDHNCETYFIGWERFIQNLFKSNICETKYLSDRLKIYDANLVGHFLSSGSNSEIDDLVFKYLGVQVDADLDPNEIIPYINKLIEILNAEKLTFDIKMYRQELIGSLENNSRDEHLIISRNKLFDRIAVLEVWLSVILANMESQGVCVDTKQLDSVNIAFSEKTEKLLKEIYYHVGHEFNLNSPKQLSEVLFDDLKLPMGRGKSGRSTREEVLDKLQDLHPVISHILEYRTVSKLHGTYIKPLIEKANSIDDSSEFKVHTNFMQRGTSSGRLSSQNPNMQNLPTGNDYSDMVKSVFVPSKGYKFLSLDYSQIELRVLAAISKDKNMTRDFKNDRDIHTSTASRILNKPIKTITKNERQLGKTINFGIVYGQTKYGLSRMLNIPVQQAEQYIEEYLSDYEGVKEYVNFITNFCSENGYVETLLGRKRLIKGIISPNIREREAAIREAINMPIQGSAADIIKLAMFDIFNFIRMKDLEDDIHLILQVHDELIFEVKENLSEDVINELINIFGNVVDLGIPLVVHKYEGNNLSELK